MNYLALVNRAKMECGVVGPDYLTALNQIGDAQRLSTWVNYAWLDIQSLYTDWQWMRQTCSFPTVDGQVEYTPANAGITSFGAWARDTFRSYNTVAGINSEIPIAYMEYDCWRDTYLIGSLRSTTSQPDIVTITPAKNLAFGPIAAGGYTIDGDYFAKPELFVADSDVPSLPDQFHMAIVFKAMMDYGSFEAASEVYQRGQDGWKKMYTRLTNGRQPELGFAGAIA